MGEVVVIGAGVAGIQAALDLAAHGITVHLVEREPSIGGHMAQLDKTFPTNDCSMCILSPKMVDVARNPKIHVYTCTDVTRVEGEAPSFRVTLLHHPRYIREVDCNGCGDCTLICPVEVYNRFDAGMGVRKAIYKPHSQAVPDIVVKDQEHCIECGLCYDVCGPEAILRKEEDRETTTTITASSLIVATGYDLIDPCIKPQFRYLEFPDVITSLEFERMMNAGGPTGGNIRCLSDGRTPDSVVFIQCVGSRDPAAGRPACSGVCCMYAIKNAILLREKYPDIEVTICYMDIRAFGKGYEEYYQRAIERGVRFLRGMPGSVEGSSDKMEIRLENTENGEMATLKPDLIVLSAGLLPSRETDRIAGALGLTLEPTGFFRSLNDKVNTVGTARPGIFLAGTATAPRDIPDSVAHGGAAAMRAFIEEITSRHAS